MGKEDLIAAVAQEAGMTKTSTEKFINSLSSVILREVSEGKEVRLSGIFSISPVARAARRVVSPRTREEITIPARRGVKIRPLTSLKNVVQAEGDNAKG